VSLCHGWAGLLYTARLVAADATDPDMFDLPDLHRQTEQRLGWPEPVRDGLLDGSAGVHLARHPVAAAGAPASGWDTCLLLNGPSRILPGTMGAPERKA
jgi:class I lanthipeptide synthase